MSTSVHDAHDLTDADHPIDGMNDFDMTGEVDHVADATPHVNTILTAVDAQLRLRTPKATARARYPNLAYASIDNLLRDPFFTTVFRDPEYSVIRFPTGRLTSCLTVNHDRARARYLLPESPALSQPRRRATPRYEPDSLPHSPTADSQDDIAYDLSTWSAFSSRSVPDSQSSSSSVDPRPPYQPISALFDTLSRSFTADSRPTKPTVSRSPAPTQFLPPAAPPSPPEWGHTPLDHVAVAPVQWQAFRWGTTTDSAGPDPEPQPWSSRRPPSQSSSDSNPDPDDDHTHLHQYMQTSSSFRGRTRVNAIGHVRDPRNFNYPLATRSLLIGLDSYSDVTVAHRDIVYAVRLIHENLVTGGGKKQYHEEGLVNIVDGPCSFRTIPALVACNPTHLPSKCQLLLA
jgi:hypothetical protein